VRNTELNNKAAAAIDGAQAAAGVTADFDGYERPQGAGFDTAADEVL
jgi:hypothetical protein